MSPPLKVAIGISSGELARYGIFWDSLMGVTLPTGTVHYHRKGAEISDNRNAIAARALAENCTHVWYVDDDQVFAPDTLLKLLDRDKDIISGLYLKREPPFNAHIYDVDPVTGTSATQWLTPLKSGVVSCDVVGAGCLLVKTAVFRNMEQPWWRLGQLRPDRWMDDIDFCLRARESGFEVHCDLEVPVGHELHLTAWPQKQADGSWITVLIGANGQPLVHFPAARPKSSLVSV